MVERLKVTHLYSSPTAIRMLMLKEESEPDEVRKYNRSTLRILGSGKFIKDCQYERKTL